MDMFLWWLDLRCCICDDEEQKKINEHERKIRRERKKKEKTREKKNGENEE